ncbi:MAG: ribonuclease ribonuclease [Candidatus Parcubacteria bacterium]|jgi:ribonuclease HII
MKTTQKWVIGIDEAGRGPLAGPVAVGVALVPQGFDFDLIPGVGDSKKVSEKNREAIYLRAKILQKQGLLSYVVVLTPAKTIDKIGIVPSITKAMYQALTKLHRQGLCNLSQMEDVLVLLDGGLKAPSEYLHQETIIKGDSKEKVIGLASIMAKVTRDQYMDKVSKLPDFLAYNFAVHKGYGTKTHLELIKKHGLSTEHRQTFCKRFKSA